MSLSLIFLLLILILFIVGFIYIEPIISKHKIKSNNEYGSARFATEAEINKNFNIKFSLQNYYNDWVW